MGKRRYEVGGDGILNNVADISADVMMRMSNIFFFVEITVVVFNFPVRQEIAEFGRVESWSMEILDGILDLMLSCLLVNYVGLVVGILKIARGIEDVDEKDGDKIIRLAAMVF